MKLVTCAFAVVLLLGGISTVLAEDPPEDPFGGGFAVNPDYEIITLGVRNDSLHARGFEWLSALDSIVLIGEESFPESFYCGEDRDVAAADFDGDFIEELVIAWNRSDHGIFLGIPTIDPLTMVPDPGGWHVLSPSIPAGVLYASDSLSEVLGEIRVVAGNFYDDRAMEFVLAYLASDSTVHLTVFEVDSATMTPEAKGTISHQPIHTALPELQRFGTAYRFDVSTGDLDNDGTDEIILVASDPSYSPEQSLRIVVYDYFQTGDSITNVSQNTVLANLHHPEVTCLRRCVIDAGDFDGDSCDEIVLADDWVRTDQDTLHYMHCRILDFDSGTMDIVTTWPWPTNYTAGDGVGHWSPNGSLNGDVYDLVVYKGELIAGGKFTSTPDGYTTLSRIARWDGSGWRPLGPGITTGVGIYALTVYQDSLLIAGGDFSAIGDSAISHIAQWDGTKWSAVGAAPNFQVRSLTVFQGLLIAGGDFTTIGGVPANRIAAWDGMAWHNLGTGADNSVVALTSWGDSVVIAGGYFHNIGGVGTGDHIGKWNGTTWGSVGGTNDPVHALTIYNDELIAGGEFGYMDIDSKHIVRVGAYDGTSWRQLGIYGLPNIVYALTVLDDSILVAAGDFDLDDMRRIGWFDSPNNVWRPFYDEDYGVDASVRALTEYEGDVILGGWFYHMHRPWGTATDCRGIARINVDSAGSPHGWMGPPDSLVARCDFPIDVVAVNLENDPASPDEIVMLGYTSRGTPEENPFHAIAIAGVDTLGGSVEGRGYFNAAWFNWGIDGLFGSRRYLGVADITGYDLGAGEIQNDELVVMVSDNHAAMVKVYELHPDSLTGWLSTVPLTASYVSDPKLQTDLMLADVDTGTIVLGTPTYYRKTDIMQPLVVLNAPPVHFDVLNDTTWDVNLRYVSNPDNCETFSVYQKKSGFTTEMSTEINKDWGVSSSLDVSIGTPGSKVKTHLGAEYGEKFSKVEGSGQTITFTATVTTGDDDQIYATQINYDIWEYPLIKNGVQLDGGGVLVVSPQPSQDVFSACKNPDRDQWIPNHEVENVLSYPNFGSLTDNHMVASANVLTKGNTGFTLDEYPWSASWAILQSDFSSEEVEEEWHAGVDVSASYQTGGSFLFGLVKWGVKVSVGFEYDQSEIQTFKTSVTDACSLGVYLGCINTDYGVCNYTVTPYAYWANNGALVLDYTTSSMVAGQGEDPTWWQIYYDQQDPAFVLPWRLDDVKGEPLASEEARYKTREILFHPSLPQPGDIVTITARVHNFGLQPVLESVGVSFYIGDPDNDGQLLYSTGGDSIFYTSEGILPQGENFVTADWQVPGMGDISSCQRIWAVIDPLDSISPEVHDNGDWATNNKGWRLFYVDTDPICVDTDGDGWADPAYRCHTCPQQSGFDNCPSIPNPDQSYNPCLSCCVGMTGNVDGDLGELIDIGDLTALIAYLYIPPNPEPGCMQEGNIDGDTGGLVDIGDLTALIAYLYIPPNPEPAPCH